LWYIILNFIKMKKMKNYIFIVAILLSTFSFAQRIELQGETIGDFTNYMSYKGKINIEDIKGSPYINDNFETAEIPPLDESFKARYNAVEDEMEVKLESGKIFVLDKAVSYTIKLNTKTYKAFNTNPDSDNPIFNYYIIENNLKHITLLKKETKKFHKKKEAANSYSSAIPAHFDDKHKTELYLKFNSNNKIVTLPTKEKRFLALFPEKKNVIKKYIKDNKISLKKEAHLNKLLKHVNTLLETK